MDINQYFRSVLEQDPAPVVLCNLEHMIIYMNPAAAVRYADAGGIDLVGQSLRKCHSKMGNDRIDQVLEWFSISEDHNEIYTFYNEVENKDVYMVALRDEDHHLIGYYEKHLYRTRETRRMYAFV